MRQELVAEILALPAQERRLLVDTVWDSIAIDPEGLSLTDWQKEEIERRFADLEADLDSGSTLEEVFERVRRKS